MNRVGAWLASLSLAWCGPAAMALSVFDVIELTRNGYDEAEIEQLIEVTNARFVIDVDSLLALGEADVADEIITLMLERGAEPPEELSEADQFIALREADFSEETIMQFVRHQNFCEPLADEDEHRLGQAGFSSAFLRNFDAQVEECREERKAVALIEPLPEEAYEEAPAQVTRVYQTNTTVYPSTVRYPRTTYYPPRYYGIYDSYYHHDRITRVYPIVVYRDYSGHKYRRYGGHRYGKAGHSHIRVGHRHGRADNRHGRPGHGGRDQDRRRRDGDGRRGDRREDRDRGDGPRRKDSDVRPRRPHPRSDPNPTLLAGKKPTNSVIPPAGRQDKVRGGVQKRVADPVSTKPFVPSVKRSDRSARQRPQRSPSDVMRRVERPKPEPSWTTPRSSVSAPIRTRASEPRYRPPQRTQPSTRPSRIPSVASPPRTPRVAPPPRPSRIPSVASPPRAPRVAPPPRPQRVAPAPRPQPVVRPPRPTRRAIDNDRSDTQEN